MGEGSEEGLRPRAAGCGRDGRRSGAGLGTLRRRLLSGRGAGTSLTCGGGPAWSGRPCPFPGPQSGVGVRAARCPRRCALGAARGLSPEHGLSPHLPDPAGLAGPSWSRQARRSVCPGGAEDSWVEGAPTPGASLVLPRWPLGGVARRSVPWPPRRPSAFLRRFW